MSGLKNNELRRHLNDRGSAEPVVARPDANLSLPSSGAQSSPKVVSQIQERANPNTFQFPWKLHDMLDTVADEGLEDVVSWEDNGRSFRVHQTQKFVESVMPRWFKQSKYKSFQVRRFET